MKKIFLLILILCVFISCTSVKQEYNTDKPNFEISKIDDYKIEINGTGNARYVYLYQYLGNFYYYEKDKEEQAINKIIQNISVIIDGQTYHLKFDDEDEGVYSFVVIDANGKKLQISGNDKIILTSERALSYTDAIAGSRVKFRDEEFGRKKYPFDCLICLSGLQIAEKTKAEQEKINLARQIIVKKYGFKNSQDYIRWLNRTNGNNLYLSLNVGMYANTIPFVEGDIVYMKKNLLTIEDMSSTSTVYLYLVTAAKNEFSKACMIVSAHQLSYMSYYGAMITESLLLRFEGKNQYQQGYSSQACDVFTVLERNSKEYNEYWNKINDMAEIEKNPYAYSDILK